MSDLIEGFLGKSVEGKKSRVPARLDFVQSATGLFMALFMWGHMIFVSSILVSKDFMNTVTEFFEGKMFLSEPNPVLVSVVVAIVFAIFIIHAGLGMRKLPINFRQWQAYRTHMKMMKHDETNMWFIQAFTGFAMFFLGSAHLYFMLTNPGSIGVDGVGDSELRMLYQWPFYLTLLLAVEFHGGIGLYRLCVKWGWFEGNNAKETRAKLKKVKWAITVFLLVLGLLTMAAYIKYGFEKSSSVMGVSHSVVITKNIDMKVA
ncbi:fumarate reductase cytochrome b subunit [Sulfurospirillum sp. 1307]